MINKYHNKKITFKGQTFDSKKEYIRYNELLLFQRAGKIKDLQRQVKYVLIPSQKDENGRVVERECSYLADFVYFSHENGKVVVEDTKGIKTKEYIIKRKLMLYLLGIKINEV